MAGEGSEERDAEDQVRVALEAMQGTTLRLLREGETHPQLMAVAAAMAAGQLAAATALAGGQDLEEALRTLAAIMVRSGREHHEMLRAEMLPVAGNA